jgi:hypothetical protein
MMNTNNRDDEPINNAEPSQLQQEELKQEERTDRVLLSEFGLAAIAGLGAFLSALFTTVIEAHSGWRPFWLVICIICLLCAMGLIVRGAGNFGTKP